MSHESLPTQRHAEAAASEMEKLKDQVREDTLADFQEIIKEHPEFGDPTELTAEFEADFDAHLDETFPDDKESLIAESLEIGGSEQGFEAFKAQEKEETLQAFDELVAEHPELEDLRETFKADFEAHQDMDFQREREAVQNLES